ncbi:hypothetical protein M514_00353 [Trichuris suis]|uniref:Uncharacterized protein n=1 Tax=Trichuris suis TaxID=68888 RepID=A0A085NGM5_9BILA|nr:hypothetical protein M513_00353 [Trichuris suis]KFD68621.1 hypothetical protein M514_00353 [Trichuris suis]
MDSHAEKPNHLLRCKEAFGAVHVMHYWLLRVVARLAHDEKTATTTPVVVVVVVIMTTELAAAAVQEEDFAPRNGRLLIAT